MSIISHITAAQLCASLFLGAGALFIVTIVLLAVLLTRINRAIAEQRRMHHYRTYRRGICAIAGLMGFCFSLACAIWNEPLSAQVFALWLLVGTPVTALLGLLFANAAATLLVEGDSRAVSQDGPNTMGYLNPSTGLELTTGEIDSGGNPIGSGWPN